MSQWDPTGSLPRELIVGEINTRADHLKWQIAGRAHPEGVMEGVTDGWPAAGKVLGSKGRSSAQEILEMRAREARSRRASPRSFSCVPHRHCVSTAT